MAYAFGAALPIVLIFWLVDSALRRNNSTRTRIVTALILHPVFFLLLGINDAYGGGNLDLSFIGYILAVLFAVSLSILLVLLRPKKKSQKNSRPSP